MTSLISPMTSRRSPLSWGVWRLPVFALVTVLAVDGAALVLPFVSGPARLQVDLFRSVMLVGTATVCSVVCYRAERLRSAIAEGRVPSLTTIWTFAAALTLTSQLIAIVVVLVMAADWPHRRLTMSKHPFRYVYSTAAVILTGLLTHLVSDDHQVLATPVVYAIVSVGFVALAMASAGHWQALRSLGSAKSWTIELATLALGFPAADALKAFPPAIALAMPLILVLQRFALDSEMAEPGVVDTESGVLSEERWTALASHHVDVDGRGAVILVHLARPETADLSSISDVLLAHVGEDAFLGRYGPGFGVFMVGSRLRGALIVRYNIEREIQALGIDALVGSAGVPESGSDIHDLLVAGGLDLMQRRANVHSGTAGHFED